MRRSVLGFLLLLASLPLLAQLPPPNEPAMVRIESKILGEQRVILVRTPPSYRTGARSYPVVYMTDGDRQIGHTAATADFLAREGRMPEVILVGISNTDRTRDLTPTRAPFDGQPIFPTSGGADKFLSFIETELIPNIEANYRTQPYRVFAGHSFGGLFALHTLATRPDLFSAIVAVSPTLTWDNRYVHRRVTELLDRDKNLKTTLYVTIGDEGEALDREFESLKALLEKRAPKGLEWEALKFGDEDHGSIVLPTHYAGLRRIFEPWRFVLDPRADPLTLHARAKEHFARTSKRAGFAIPVPEPTTNVIGYRLMAAGHLPEAIAVFRTNAEAYPQSANVYDSLGEAYEKQGDLDQARTNYARAAEIGKRIADPNAAIYEQNLQRVTKPAGSASTAPHHVAAIVARLDDK